MSVHSPCPSLEKIIYTYAIGKFGLHKIFHAELSVKGSRVNSDELTDIRLGFLSVIRRWSHSDCSSHCRLFNLSSSPADVTPSFHRPKWWEKTKISTSQCEKADNLLAPSVLLQDTWTGWLHPEDPNQPDARCRRPVESVVFLSWRSCSHRARKIFISQTAL